MSKSKDEGAEQTSEETRREESATAPGGGGATMGTPPAGPQTAARPGQPNVQLDESHAMTAYANFCRVTGTPEEVILDLGLNANPFGTPAAPVKVSQRLVLNYFTAKRLLGALSMTIQRHEQTFGVLETDVQKRVRRT